MTHNILTFDELGITLPEIAGQMGMPEEAVDEAVAAEINAVLSDIRGLVRPEYAFYITDGTLAATAGEKTLEAGGTVFNIGNIIYRQLRGSAEFAFFVATAGKAFQRYQDCLKEEGDVMREFTAGAIGSVIAEKTADKMEEALQALLDERGLHRTNRFSPGYCGWHVREQRAFFDTFPAASPCGIELTPSCLMLPIKSVSGVIGVGESVRRMDYTCGLCDFKDCYRRKLKVKS